MVKYQVDHLHLISPAIEETKEWYCNVFGGKVTFEGNFKGKQVYYVDVNGFNIILIEQFPDEEPLPATIQTKEGLDHFGFAVEDMDAAAADSFSVCQYRAAIRLYLPRTYGACRQTYSW